MARYLVVETRNRGIERWNPSARPSRCVTPEKRTLREVIIETCNRFPHRKPRALGHGVVLDGDVGDVQYVTVIED